MIRIYQSAVSPWLGSNCRFHPPCSEFARRALETEGTLKGLFLALGRLFSCHPFHPGGYDPVEAHHG